MGNIELLDFYADWCGPCQQMKPIINELEKELDGKVKFITINIDEDQDTAQQYNVMSLPTFIIKKGGQVVDQLNGPQSKEVLTSKLS